MLINKFFILGTFLLAAVILAANAAPAEIEKPTKAYVGNNLILGDPLEGSRLLARQYVYKEATERRIVFSNVTVSTPSDITFLTVLEERNDDVPSFSSFPILLSGGPGSESATVLFASWIGKPISFTITAYGNK